MKKNTKIAFLIGTLASFVVVVGAIGVSELKGKVDYLMASANAIEGVSATNSHFKITVSEMEVTTTITIDKDKANFLGEQVADYISAVYFKNETLELQIVNKFDNFSYPLKGWHTIKIKNYSIKSYEPVPLQLASLSSLGEGFVLVGMSDHIKYGQVADISPFRFSIKLNSSQSNLSLQGNADRLKFTAPDNSELIMKHVGLRWDSKPADCSLCIEHHVFTAGEITQVDPNGYEEITASNIGIKMGSLLVDGRYNFTLNIQAKEFNSPLIQWSEILMSSVIGDVSNEVIEEFSKERDGEELFGLTGHNNEMYARLLEKGMFVEIKEVKANTQYGQISSSMHLRVEEGKAPNLVLNPLGIIMAINGDFKATAPKKELNKLFGADFVEFVLSNQFATSTSKNLFTEISVEDGEAIINGKVMSL